MTLQDRLDDLERQLFVAKDRVVKMESERKAIIKSLEFLRDQTSDVVMTNKQNKVIRIYHYVNDIIKLLKGA